MEDSNSQLKSEVEELSSRKTEAERKVKVLENQVSEANARLTDDEHHVTELQSVKVKLQKELEASVSQLEEFESKCSTAERAKASLESQLAELQVNLWGFMWMRFHGNFKMTSAGFQKVKMWCLENVTRFLSIAECSLVGLKKREQVELAPTN